MCLRSRSVTESTPLYYSENREERVRAKNARLWFCIGAISAIGLVISGSLTLANTHEYSDGGSSFSSNKYAYPALGFLMSTTVSCLCGAAWY